MMEYKHILKFDSEMDLQHDEYQPTLLLNKPLSKQERNMLKSANVKIVCNVVYLEDVNKTHVIENVLKDKFFGSYQPKILLKQKVLPKQNSTTKNVQFFWLNRGPIENNLVQTLEKELSDLIPIEITQVDRNKIDENQTLLIGIFYDDTIDIESLNLKSINANHCIVLLFHSQTIDDVRLDIPFCTFQMYPNTPMLIPSDDNTTNVNLLSVFIFDTPDDPRLGEIKDRKNVLDNIEFRMMTTDEEYENLLQTLEEPEEFYQTFEEHLLISGRKEITLGWKDNKRYILQSDIEQLIHDGTLPDFRSSKLKSYPNPMGYLLQKYDGSSIQSVQVTKKNDHIPIVLSSLASPCPSDTKLSYIMVMLLKKDGKNRIVGEYSGFVLEDDTLRSDYSKILIHPAYRNMGLCYMLAEKTYRTLIEKYKLDEIKVQIVNNDYSVGTCKCYLSAAMKIGLRIYYKNIDITKQIHSIPQFCDQSFDSEDQLTLKNPEFSIKDKEIFTDIGILTETIDIPTVDQFLNAYIPELDYLHTQDSTQLENFVRQHNLLFYIAANPQKKRYLSPIIETILKNLFNINQNLVIVGLVYRDIFEGEFRTGRVYYSPIKLNIKGVEKCVKFYEVYYRVEDEKMLLIHKMNDKVYKEMRQQIAHRVSDYKEYIANIPALQPPKDDPDKIRIPLTTYEAVIGRECAEQNIELDSKELSRGQYGVVYGASMEIDNVRVPIVVKTELILDRELLLDNFVGWENEIRFQNRAADINIAPKIYKTWYCDQIDDDGEEITVGFIAMEKIDGITLHDYLMSGQSSHGETQLIFQKIRELFIRLYSIDVNHGDIHGKNIMLIMNDQNKFESIQLLDFGYAMTFDDVISINDILYIVSQDFLALYPNIIFDVDQFIAPLTPEQRTNLIDEREKNREHYAEHDRNFVYISDDEDDEDYYEE